MGAPGGGQWPEVDSAKPDEALAALQAAGAFHCRPADIPFPAPDPAAERPAGSVRLVLISDTHGYLPEVPPGDVLIHAGDFSDTGNPRQIEHFAQWLGAQPHQHKIVVGGNHDLTMDPEGYPRRWRRFGHRQQYDCAPVKEALASAATVLDDSGCEAMGLRFWGSPWQPMFHDWAFNLPRGEALRSHWAQIPAGIDVLVTHTPPLGHGDRCSHGGSAGCVDLLREVTQRVRPRLHVFGHIHEGYGATSDGTTTYVNPSTCTLQYDPTNPPVVIDLPQR